ncbi:MAG: hypothetical protein CMO34_02220 [Verrucomicrobia bacterium]|nr:hypothetical protein [Verrucomicrobiota bacterium]
MGFINSPNSCLHTIAGIYSFFFDFLLIKWKSLRIELGLFTETPILNSQMKGNKPNAINKKHE